MRRFLVLSLVSCLAILGVATSHADSLTAYFNLSCPSGTCAVGQDPATSVAPEGQITLTLLGNGTVDASLEDTTAIISGFGFDQCLCNITESGFTPGTPDDEYGWMDDFGSQESGFGSYVTYDVPSDESWIIGNPGEYTSVDQLLNGGDSTVNFVLLDSNGEFGADPEIAGIVTPEPNSLILLGTGVLGLLGAVRRKLAR